MPEPIASRLRDLARRAGLEGISPSVVAAFGVVVVVAVLLGVWRWWPRDDARVETVQTASLSREASGAVSRSRAAVAAAEREGGGGDAASRESSSTRIYVHVVGAVRHPGLYQLNVGARVADGVRDAGGFAGDAAQEAVNLARVLADGEQVLVPTKDEAKRAGGRSLSGGQGLSAGGSSGAGAGTAGGAGSAGSPGPGAGALVNINTADAAALDTLPGVGPSTAAKIVADREANGRFMSPDDLGRVPGIGPKKLEQLKAMICVE